MATLAKVTGPSALWPDDVLMPISHTQWMATNAFCVTTPLLRAKLLFELTAVDVPRTHKQADALTNVIVSVVDEVNRSSRAYVRLDHGQNFPTELFADVIYLSKRSLVPAEAADKAVREDTMQWHSLQESLLRGGVAILSRPCAVRLPFLIQAEAEGASPSVPCPWLRRAITRERSATFNVTARCRVVDVVKGDVFVVEWVDSGCLDSSATPRTAAAAPAAAAAGGGGGESAHWPPLLVLDAVVCMEPSTVRGLRALRWSQQHVLHTTLTVTIHSREPLDKDVSLSTQLDSLEQLACVRGAAHMTAPGEQDIAATLLRLGLAHLRCGIDAGVPRPSNFLPLLATTTVELPPLTSDDGEDQGTGTSVSDAVLGTLVRLWQLPPAYVKSLCAFHGQRWTQEVLRHCTHVSAVMVNNLPTNPPTFSQECCVGLTPRLWARCAWCASVSTDSLEGFEHVFSQRPLRTLCSLATLVASKAPPTRGLVTNATVVSTCNPAKALFLQVEVNLLAPISQWAAIRQAAGVATANLFHLDPPPRAEPYLTTHNTLEVEVDCDTALLPSREQTCIRIQVKHRTVAQHSTGESDTSNDKDEENEEDEDESVETVKVEWPERHATINLAAPTTPSEVREYEVCLQCLTADCELPALPAYTVRYWVCAAAPDAKDNEPALIEDAAEALLDLRGDQAGGGDVGGVGEADEEDRPSSSLSDTDDRRADATAAVGAASEGSHASPFGGDANDKSDGPSTMTPTVTPPHYFAKVLMFFALPAFLTMNDFLTDNARHFDATATPVTVTDRIRRLAADLLHQDVAVTFAARATVNGVRGVVGDLFFFSASDAPTPDIADDAVSGTLSPAVNGALRQSLLGALESVGAVGGSDLLQDVPPADWWPTAAAIRDAATTPLREHFVAGEAPLWVEHQDRTLALPVLCGRTFTPLVSLATFSVRPRQLFCGTTNDQHKIVVKEERAGEDDSVQNIDWAVMRLAFRRLPNLMTCNLELLPTCLRNAERAYCHDIFSSPTSSRCDSRVSASTTIRCGEDRDTETLARPLPVLHGDEASTARVLTLLMLLMRDDAVPAVGAEVSTATSASTAYRLLSQQCKPPEGELKDILSTEAVLYLSPHRLGGAPGARDVFLGIRDTQASDLFEDSAEPGNIAPDTLPHPLGRGDLRRAVAVMGREALTDEPSADTHVQLTSEQLCDEVCPLTRKGLGPVPSRAHTRRLYHPAPDVHILGFPLTTHEEIAPEELERLIGVSHVEPTLRVEDLTAPFGKQQKYIGVEYVPVYLAKNNKPYKLFSYGRIGRAAIGELQRLRTAFGGDAMTYVSLLLRQSVTSNRTHTSLPDGQLFVYGVASEALYAHYRSRRDLRFSLGTLVPVLQSITCKPRANGPEDDRASEEAEETCLLERLCLYLRTVLQRVIDKLDERGVRSSRVLLHWVAHLGNQHPYVAVHVYPVNEDETLQRPGERDRNNVESFQGNPHRPFSIGYGIVRHRLPLGELRITYTREANTPAFTEHWLAQLEPETSAP